MDTILAGLPGVVAYLDDVIVVGGTEEEHRRNLHTAFRRIAESGLHVRMEKCRFATSSINYLGYIIDKHGRRPDPKKIEAITKMPVPQDISRLRSFLGLLSYYGTFIKEMRSLRAPLDALLAKNAKFNWTKECNVSFNRAKSILSSDHYDPSQEIIVAGDASNYGVGAVISHRYADGSEKAVAHAFRSLQPAEKNCSQIEKEALALIFAVQKFHRKLHGRKFTLLTDHKPLLAIFGSKKGIPVYIANRLQRWATTLLAYDFHVQYRSTDKFGQADALSRLIATYSAPEEERVISAISADEDIKHIFTNAVQALPVTADEVRKWTAQDRLLQQVNSYLRRAWPTKITNPKLLCFYNRRNALSTLDGCLLMADRVVIPELLQSRVLRQLHKGHPGIVRMKALARSYAY
nr:RNA-directed DNA polymerase (reverse transcriptase) domain containing protein [Haemonchus contortus]